MVRNLDWIELALENARCPAKKVIGGFITFMTMGCRWCRCLAQTLHPRSASGTADEIVSACARSVMLVIAAKRELRGHVQRRSSNVSDQTTINITLFILGSVKVLFGLDLRPLDENFDKVWVEQYTHFCVSNGWTPSRWCQPTEIGSSLRRYEEVVTCPDPEGGLQSSQGCYSAGYGLYWT